MNYSWVHITSFIIIHFIDEFVDVNNGGTGKYNVFFFSMLMKTKFYLS